MGIGEEVHHGCPHVFAVSDRGWQVCRRFGGSNPVLANWLSSLPRYLQTEEGERVIAACDPATSVGKRDRAILLLLARLGLRAGDIVQLRLGDADWKDATISVSGKSRHQTLIVRHLR